MMESEIGVLMLCKMELQVQEHMQHLDSGKGNKVDFLPEPPKRTQLYQYLDFRTSDIPNCKVRNLCCFKR